jgi:predicted PurR-regulated permease PerM
LIKQTDLARFLSWTLALGFSTIFLSGLFLMTRPFFEGFAWAIVLVLMTWPIYQTLINKFKFSESFASLCMTFGIAILCLLVVVPVVIELAREVYLVSQEGRVSIKGISESLLEIPLVGKALASEHFSNFIDSVLKKAGELSIDWTGKVTQGIFHAFFNIALMLFSLYFLFRYGYKTINDAQSILVHYSGLNWQRIFTLAADTIKGVVYGALVTAFAQGILAGIGYYVAGTPVPAFFGLLTTLMSFVPFGAPIVYAPLSLYLFVSSGSWVGSLGLLLWGVLVVSTIDNILRPLFISQTMKLPILIVFIGVVGGILAFGLIGLFIGPVLVALGKATWSELVSRSMHAQKAEAL